MADARNAVPIGVSVAGMGRIGTIVEIQRRSIYAYVCVYTTLYVHSATYVSLELNERMKGGDASTRTVALIQDPEMAALKNTSGTRELLQPGLSRGRSGYTQLGVLRTKPGVQPLYELRVITHFTKSGRADAPATLCMSCSDKIAMWSSVGMQGALLVDLGLEPVRLASILVGDVLGYEEFYGDLELVRQDCQRAFGERLRGVTLPDAYEVRTPEVFWTPRRFGGSRRRPTEERASSNECTAFSIHR